MATLSPADLINLASSTIRSRVVGTDANGLLIVAHHDQPANRSLDQHITVGEHAKRVVTAASIMFAESGGRTDAFRPASQNPAGGNDRGLWQWNSKAWPNIADQTAFDPTASTEIAYKVSKGFTSWGPWRGSAGLNPASTPSKTIATTYESMLGRAVDDTPILSQIDPNADGIPDAAQTLLDWGEALGRLLSHLIDPAFWKRVGIGAAGAALLVAAAAVLLADNLPNTPIS